MVINRMGLLEAQPIRKMLETKERHEESGTSYGLTEAGYDIRVKQDIYFTSDGVLVKEDENIMIHGAGNFTIASAIEEFQMPEHLVGIVHDKSTWARQGLSVFNTVIEPNWKGFLTLELVYHGQKYLHIPAGSGIAQVIFHTLHEDAYYSGKYQNQPDRPVGAIT